ncbi:MAG TPA: hypothetical protein VN688_21830 [Gemmataceae bacterium]|nr:hypothetical protein [Gemmataceae bacterium]
MSSVMQRQSTNRPIENDRNPRRPISPTAYVLMVQGIYYLATGIWPLVSIDTFQMVTGPKTDLWLVDTVGVLIAVIAVVLLVAAWRRQTIGEVILLAVGSALALIGIDVIFVAQKVIPRIYLLDAAAEGALVIAWIAALIIEARTLWKRSDSCL